jgi:hypothetical protein
MSEKRNATLDRRMALKKINMIPGRQTIASSALRAASTSRWMYFSVT